MTATFDHRGGQKLYNLTGVYRNAIFLNGAAVQQPDASNLAEQAAAQAATYGLNGGYIEDASFTKLREVALALTLPQRFAARVRAARPRSRSPGGTCTPGRTTPGSIPRSTRAAQANFSTADFLTAAAGPLLHRAHRARASEDHTQ